MDEVWKEIPNTDYSVSDQGRVASRKFGKWRVMKRRRNSEGYMHAGLCGGSGKQRNVKIHVLVAEAFLGPRPTPHHQINHKNGARGDNRVENLEWCTPKENVRHRFDVLGQIGRRGERNNTAKLTETYVREIRVRVLAGEKRGSIAADYGIDQSSVSDIATGKSWGWLS